MARRASRLAATLVAALPAVAFAQTLELFHVGAFALSSDRTTVAVGEAFHLTLRVHVDERVDELDNVQLPNLAGFEDLGDERRCVRATPAGSDCTEIVTVDAIEPGEKSVGPASIEFLDPATARIRTLDSNSVAIRVTGTALASPGPVAADEDPVAGWGWAVLRALGTFVLVAVAAWALLWGYRKGARVPLHMTLPSLPSPPPELPLEDWPARMRAMGALLAAEPTRARAVAVRAELRRRLGASERETIADLVRRDAATGDGQTMAALAAVERAAFCEETHVVDAALEAVPFLSP